MKQYKTNQLKTGAMLSYIAIILNIVSGLIYTPWMITKIGQSQYGLYTLATSFITLFLMDFGMSSAVTRFLSIYNARNDQDGVNNFLGVVYKLYILIDAVIFIILLTAYFFIGNIYDNLPPDELQIFKVLYIIVGLFSVISFPFTNLNGILTAYEKFVPLKICDMTHKIGTVIIMVIVLLLGGNVYSLVAVNAIVGLTVIAIKLVVIKKDTVVKVNFGFFSKGILKQIFGFSVWTTVSSIMQRLIFNIAPTIIAAVSVTGSVGVAVFGLGSSIEGYVYTFAAALSGMFMPRVSKIIESENKDKDLFELLIRIGHLQVILVGFIVIGFISFGRTFIVDIWHKPDFELSYICTVLLIIPSFFHMPMEIANTALVVEGRVKLQAFVMCAMGLVSICSSLVLSKYYGALGASIAIFMAYMVRTILFAIVYDKVLHINMKRFAKEVFIKLAPHFILTLIAGLLLERFNPIANVYIRFGVNVLSVTIIYFAIMNIKGFNRYEKQMIEGMLNKVKYAIGGK